MHRNITPYTVLIAPVPPNHEWLKILASAGAGLIAGLVAEPIKSSMQNWVLARQIRLALHREIAEWYVGYMYTLRDVKDYSEESHRLELLNLQLEMYDHFFEVNRNLFYSNDGLYELSKTINQMKGMRAFLEIESCNVKNIAETTFAVMNTALASGIVDERLMTVYLRKRDRYEEKLFPELATPTGLRRIYVRTRAWLKRKCGSQDVGSPGGQ